MPDGRVVGTSVLSINGSVGWIGTVWVDPAWRRRGIGLDLTRATIEEADGAGCRTLVLVATEAGRPLYERLGFEVQTWYRILQIDGLDGPAADPRIRAFRAGDLGAMAALDAAATGEDRTHLLHAFAAPDTTRVLARDDGSLGGFVVRAPWGGGATIAPRIEDAEAILHARRIASGAAGRVRAGLLAENEAGLDRLAATRLDRIVAGAAARARRAARLGSVGDLGPVQPRVRLTGAPQPPPARTVASARRAWPRWTRSWPAARRKVRS